MPVLDDVQFYTNFNFKKKKIYFFNNNDSLKICIFSSCSILYKFSFKKQIYIFIFLIIIMSLYKSVYFFFVSFLRNFSLLHRPSATNP